MRLFEISSSSLKSLGEVFCCRFSMVPKFDPRYANRYTQLCVAIEIIVLHGATAEEGCVEFRACGRHERKGLNSKGGNFFPALGTHIEFSNRRVPGRKHLGSCFSISLDKVQISNLIDSAKIDNGSSAIGHNNTRGISRRIYLVLSTVKGMICKGVPSPFLLCRSVAKFIPCPSIRRNIKGQDFSRSVRRVVFCAKVEFICF